MNEDFGVPWGPWGFNSGMGTEDVDRDEAVELGVMREEDEVRPVEREFNEGLQAGVREMGGGMLAALERATGGRAAGGVLRARERVAENAPDSAPSIPRLAGSMEKVAESGHPRLLEQWQRASKTSKAGAGLLGADVLEFDRLIRDAFGRKGWMK